ncbi:uncharacterized protein METZ01_LOCUS494219, partial [marine metagenome]
MAVVGRCQVDGVLIKFRGWYKFELRYVSSSFERPNRPRAFRIMEGSNMLLNSKLSQGT